MDENKQIMEVDKIYTFRKLKAEDIPHLVNVLKKVGFNKLTNVFKSDAVVGLLSGQENTNSLIAGGAIVFEIAQIILESVGDCEDIFTLLANTSNLSIDEIKNLDLDIFFNMVVDFIKKDEFMSFFKVASKYFATEK